MATHPPNVRARVCSVCVCNRLECFARQFNFFFVRMGLRIYTEVHQFERKRACYVFKEHCSTTWLDSRAFCWFYHSACSVVVLGSFGSGQQNCGNGGAWLWCSDDPFPLQIVHNVKSSVVLVRCC